MFSFGLTVAFQQIQKHGCHLSVRSDAKDKVKCKAQRQHGNQYQAGHVVRRVVVKEKQEQIVAVVRLSEERVHRKSSGQHQEVGVVEQSSGR